MNNQREIYEALLAGEKITSTDFDADEYICFKNDQIEDEAGRRFIPEFDVASDWQIYKEPHWRENISGGGVLCKSSIHNTWFHVVIVNYSEKDSAYISDDGRYINLVTPLPKQEIQVFMDNAPEG